MNVYFEYEANKLSKIFNDFTLISFFFDVISFCFQYTFNSTFLGCFPFHIFVVPVLFMSRSHIPKMKYKVHSAKYSHTNLSSTLLAMIDFTIN